MSHEIDDDITLCFTPKAPSAEGLAKLQALRIAAIEFMATIRKLAPNNERRLRAEHLVEQGVMLAAKAITHQAPTLA